MPTIPLALRLRRAVHRDIAAAQDLMVIDLYSALPASVMHGGTAIWRCYGGNRFSEDIDVYLPPSLRGSFGKFLERLKEKGFAQTKVKQTKNAIFANFELRRTAVRFEASLRPKKSVVKEYEAVDGNFLTVRTIPPDELLSEKAMAYTSRRLVKDLYDVFFLVHRVEAAGTPRQNVVRMLKEFHEPVDGGGLEAIVISGVAPNVEEMLEGISEWAGRGT
ncbi:MAG: nucleotidyl transferase AbiEii/AbiGii toxin family protein [Thaumarchaeota archaeon]|nr:nucleotidyl transferase AbiEii/AbiGii toxin family protein [Nitrososphaerota archaeon]